MMRDSRIPRHCINNQAGSIAWLVFRASVPIIRRFVVGTPGIVPMAARKAANKSQAKAGRSPRRAPSGTRKGGPVVGIIMGSQSDWTTMHHAAELLATLGVAHETRIVSAHRTPKRMVDYAENARSRGIRVIIAGAGGAAHLPGMTASLTSLPVLGVPVE